MKIKDHILYSSPLKGEKQSVFFQNLDRTDTMPDGLGEVHIIRQNPQSIKNRTILSFYFVLIRCNSICTLLYFLAIAYVLNFCTKNDIGITSICDPIAAH